MAKDRSLNGQLGKLGMAFFGKLGTTFLGILLTAGSLSATPESAFDEIHAFLAKNYYDRDFLETTWPKIVEEARKRLSNTESSSEGYRAISEALQSFGHSHIAFYPPSAPFGQEPREPLEDLDKGDDPVIHVDQDHGDGPVIHVDQDHGDGPMSRFGHVSLPRRLIVDRRKDGVLYIAFSAFTLDQVLEVKKAIQENRNSRGVILDLRGNPGGVGAFASSIALEFCTKAYNLGSMKGMEMNLRFPVLPQSEVHPGPVALLVDARSLSTSEILARGMQLAGTAKVFGQKTPGKALPSLILGLQDGSRFQVPVADFRDEEGVSLEGKGVTPDFEIGLTTPDLSAGTDPVLEAAVDWIKKR